MNRFLGAAALALLIATPVLAQTASPQPASPAASAPGPDRQTAAVRHQHEHRLAHHRFRGNRAEMNMGNSACPADSTNEAGGTPHAGGYCLPGGRS